MFRTRICSLAMGLSHHTIMLPKLHCCHMSSNRSTKSFYKIESKKMRLYIVERYLRYLKSYDKLLEHTFQGAMQIYRAFTIGLKDFVADLREYFKIVRLVNSPDKGSKFEKLRRREIELYQQMPKDMRRVAAVLLISALPLLPYIVFPLAYIYPRIFLSRHFWSLQQKSEFKIYELKLRLMHNRPLFRCVQSKLERLCDHPFHHEFSAILGQMGSGVQPSVEQILECKDLFTREPYHLFYLTRKHIRHLCKIHDLHMGWFRRSRLMERAWILKEMDKAIMREGGVHNLPLDALKEACVLRGLNPTNMRNEDIIMWLNNWIKISNVIDRENLSLLLHCPILLAYNEPSNWLLIYGRK